MAPKITFIPGLFGSSVATDIPLPLPLQPLVGTPGLPFQIWPTSYLGNAVSAILGGLDYLGCNADGTPAYPSSVTGLHDEYQEIVTALGATATPYDWRRDPATAAAQYVVPKITEPTWLVAHSFGNAVLLNAYRQLQAQGKANLIQGVIILAGPLAFDTANWTAYDALNGQGDFFNLFLLGSGLSAMFSTVPVTIYDIVTHGLLYPRNKLLDLMATWDSIGYLIPTQAAVRSAAFWSGKNPYVTQAWLDRGLAARNADKVPSLPNYWQIYGVGYPTATGSASQTLVGDGTVAKQERLPDLPAAGGCTQTIVVAADHSEIVHLPVVVELINRIIAGQPVGFSDGVYTVHCDTSTGVTAATLNPPTPTPTIPSFTFSGGVFLDP